MDRTRILLTNDDGYRAEGIRRLAEELGSWADVTVVTPDREQSGTGHSITLHRPLRLSPMPAPDGVGDWYLVDGTPTDCVNLGLNGVLRDRSPHLVVAGINVGLNLGDDVSYSGTVGAALEAYIFGFPAFAFSQRTDGDFDMAASARRASQLLRWLWEDPDGRDSRAVLLNINFPLGHPKGLQFVRLGRRVYRDTVQVRNDPRGVEYYWISGRPEWDDSPGTDLSAIHSGYISVTPLRLDLTDDSELSRLDQSLPWSDRFGELE